MKFKLFFLGLFAAAFMISCNNEIVDDGQENGQDVGENTYATIALNIKNGTYGGENIVTATTLEQAVSDAAMYVYKWDGASMEPEAFAYLPITTTPPPPSITVMVKSGPKQIFFALNVGNSALNLLPLTAANMTSSQALIDTGLVLPPAQLFTVTNNALYSTSATAFSKTAPTGTILVNSFNGNGLIMTLAGGSMVTGNGMINSIVYNPNYRNLMTNWRGPNDPNAVQPNLATSQFNLLPNISASNSKTGPNNHVIINVQRAFAKISLRITADGATPNASASWRGPYPSSEDDGSKGIFTPWGYTPGTTMTSFWALGGINKSTYPFQNFVGSQIASPNFLKSVGDTIIVNTPSLSDTWYNYFDNTRVFGANRNYYTSSNTVTNVKNAMSAVGASVVLSEATPWTPAFPAPATNRTFVFATENGTVFPQIHDKSTFAIIGGTYAPRLVLTSIIRAEVTTNQPHKGWNLQPATVGVDHTGLTGFDYPALVYGTNDTLYYLVGEKTFIFGRDNLVKYFAWEPMGGNPQIDKDAPPATPMVSVLATAEINKRVAEGTLVGYFQGQCFYRIWVKDGGLADNDPNKILVRRNHVYDININKIKGPGIGDPNKIIIPGEIIPDLDTFVTAEINILPWHYVSDNIEVDMK